ncbi:RDD family protein [Ornithinimicrobium sp. Arc0846-15]|nr:RDD family protein [Ornithinimicrobium laminariae]
MSQQPAGWYDDPRDSDQLRYWDGAQWTPHTHPKAPRQQVAPAPQQEASAAQQQTDAAEEQAAETEAFPNGERDGESKPAAETEAFRVGEQGQQSSDSPSHSAAGSQAYGQLQQSGYGQQSYEPQQQSQPQPDPFGSTYQQQSQPQPDPFGSTYQQADPVVAHGGQASESYAQQWNVADTALVGEPAPWWRRLVARILDSVLIGLVVGIPMLLILSGEGIGVLTLWAGVGVAVLGFVYELVLLKTMSATLGKLAMGLRVRKLSDGAPLSWGTSATRSATWNGPSLLSNIPWVGFLFNIFNLVNGLWPLWDSKNQSLNDKAAGTQVIQTN